MVDMTIPLGRAFMVGEIKSNNDRGSQFFNLLKAEDGPNFCGLLRIYEF